jgi:hypothetical protein
MTIPMRSSLHRSSSGLLVLLATAASLAAQSAARDNPSTWRQVYVDDHCQVMTADGQFQADPDVCHLDGGGVQVSSHLAAKEVDGVRLHAHVIVQEQTYLLQNINAEPVVFVVAQQVPPGWHIDSDPQPVQLKGNVAIFRVVAQPGQIVRLHVGRAHESPFFATDDQ